MTTREWTKVLKENPSISTIEINGDDVKGEVIITRLRNTERERRYHRVFDTTTVTIRESEIDVSFDGLVKSSMEKWYKGTDYPKRQFNNWFRGNKQLREEISYRLKLIGGSSEYKIKKIVCTK